LGCHGAVFVLFRHHVEAGPAQTK